MSSQAFKVSRTTERRDMTEPQQPTPSFDPQQSAPSFEQPSWQPGAPDAQPPFPQPPAAQPLAPQGYPAYPAAPYGYALPEHPQGTTILVLGILGLFFAVTGPFALVMGNRARKDIAAGQYAQSTSVTIGWVLGIITTLYLALVVVIIALMIPAILIAANS